MKIFREKELFRPSFFTRIFGKQPKENALIEINNLLAVNQANLKNLSIDKILEIGEKYNVAIYKQFYQSRCELFKSYLEYILTDKKIEESEILDLQHLKQILFLNDIDTQNLLTVATKKIYEEEVNDAIADGE
jgi:hypothetical protein